MAAFIVGLIWKKKHEINRNILCYILWISITSIHGFEFGIVSTFILIVSSPRVFHELFNNTLTVQCTWILNAIYPILCPTKNDNMKLPKTHIHSSEGPTVSIILCNKDESKEVFDHSLQSIIKSKTYAEHNLSISHVRIILADGGSKNIEDIINCYGSIFDSVEIIPGGKLSGRHLCSIKETRDIIVAYDSDRKYEKRNTYELLLPFVHDWRKYILIGRTDETRVVGTTHYVNSDGIFPFNGGNSAYLRNVYLRYPFNTKINQTTTSSIWKEEEIDWANNLVKCGKVVSVPALYSDISPLPFLAWAKRMLNLKNSFVGGLDRWNQNESISVIIYKITIISVFAVFLPLLL